MVFVIVEVNSVYSQNYIFTFFILLTPKTLCVSTKKEKTKQNKTKHNKMIGRYKIQPQKFDVLLENNFHI